jgi:hypothetical protein
MPSRRPVATHLLDHDLAHRHVASARSYSRMENSGPQGDTAAQDERNGERMPEPATVTEDGSQPVRWPPKASRVEDGRPARPTATPSPVMRRIGTGAARGSAPAAELSVLPLFEMKHGIARPPEATRPPVGNRLVPVA